MPLIGSTASARKAIKFWTNGSRTLSTRSHPWLVPLQPRPWWPLVVVLWICFALAMVW